MHIIIFTLPKGSVIKMFMLSAIIYTLLPIHSVAQITPSSGNEIGVNFSNLNNFGLRYKHGKEISFLRLTLLSISGFKFHSEPDSIATSKSSIGFGFNIGFEKRKLITENFYFYSGLDLITSLNSQVTDESFDKIKFEKKSVSVGVGYVFGLSYKIRSDIFISAEVLPSIIYSHDKLTNTIQGIVTKLTNNGFTYGLSNSGASLTLIYKFEKNK